MLVIQEDKIEKYIAVSITCMVCTMRIATAVSEIACGIALLLAILLWHKGKRSFSLSENIRGYMKAYGVFMLCAVPSLIFSDSPADSTKAYFGMWVWRYVPFVVIAVFIKRREYLLNMLAVYMTVSSAECMISLAQVMKNANPNFRAVGFGGNELTFGGIICMLLPVALVILMDSSFETRLKKAAFFAVISSVIGLLCNKSRGAWLAELIMVPVVTFRYLKQNKKLLLALLVVILSIAGFMLSNPHYMRRVQSITNTRTDRSNADRIRVWKSAKKMVQDHPVTGVGQGQFKNHYKKYKLRRERQNLTHTHNNFVQVSVENGIIGLAGLLYFVGAHLYISLRNYCKHKNPYDILVFTIFLGYICLFGQIDYSLGSSVGIRVMWFLMAVLLKLKETEIRRCELLQ
ncbi:MAG: O-antigen ligase family protein [Acidaminococcaceae bacterium]|nr:O-antigen ligase family protein [Acidaminococcaceae bacterium]